MSVTQTGAWNHTIVWRAALCVGLVATFVLGVGDTSADAATSTVKLQISSSSQKQILETGKLTVRVSTSRHSGSVRLRGFVAGSSIVADGNYRLKSGTHTASLTLTSAGRRTVAGCAEGRALKMTANSASPKISAATSSTLLIDSRACDEPVGGTAAAPAMANADRCDYLDGEVCLQPWPNDYFTVPDKTTPTGRRLNLNRQSMPANTLGVHIDPIDYNRADGFSPGNMVIAKVPGLETPAAFTKTGAVPVTDMGRYADADQPVVVINTKTGKRQPIFTELDANPKNPSDVNLIIRPTVNFDEGGHYIVAMRNLKDGTGTTIQPAAAFKNYRDRLVTPNATFEARRPHMEDLLHTLQDAGIKRKNLYLAWDFTVASEHSLSSRMLSMRDDAFHQLGDDNLADMKVQGAAPTFTITKVTDLAPCGTDGCAGETNLGGAPNAGQVCGVLKTVAGLVPLLAGINCSGLPGYAPGESDKIARHVEGKVTVPCYLNIAGCPTGSEFKLDGNGKPTRNGDATATFACNIPRSANASQPAKVSLYGHGLLGSADEVNGGNVTDMSNENNFMFCATDWAGFATQDLATILLNLQDLSHFNRVIDRIQQGFLNFDFLGRAMIHSSGFAANPAFQDADGHPLIDSRRLFYDGNSQGGIMGGGLTAQAPDFNRAVLGVPGMNYSTLLQRSSDFAPYAEGKLLGDVADNLSDVDTPFGLYDSYPNQLERPLIFSLMQLLWDRGEANGYAHHMTTDPLPNTPAHTVLLHAAFGDHQVSNLTAETAARTIGAKLRAPALDPSRSTIDDTFGLATITSYPFAGSALVFWDGGPQAFPGGTAPAPITNTPPGPSQGGDPHSYPRNTFDARRQKAAFLALNGSLINVCGARPCYSHGYPGP